MSCRTRGTCSVSTALALRRLLLNAWRNSGPRFIFFWRSFALKSTGPQTCIARRCSKRGHAEVARCDTPSKTHFEFSEKAPTPCRDRVLPSHSAATLKFRFRSCCRRGSILRHAIIMERIPTPDRYDRAFAPNLMFKRDMSERGNSEPRWPFMESGFSSMDIWIRIVGLLS